MNGFTEMNQIFKRYILERGLSELIHKNVSDMENYI